MKDLDSEIDDYREAAKAALGVGDARGAIDALLALTRAPARSKTAPRARARSGPPKGDYLPLPERRGFDRVDEFRALIGRTVTISEAPLNGREGRTLTVTPTGVSPCRNDWKVWFLQDGAKRSFALARIVRVA